MDIGLVQNGWKNVSIIVIFLIHVVFEDAPKGVESALNAGMRSVVLTLLHERREFEQYPNIITYIENYENLSPANVIARGG